MHQTFYIDIDEEITSIVDRLKKAKASEIILVVPKRALLIQSIVNLKLLKKEAENLNTQIMIVTQDKLGKILIEKAGILVQNKLDEVLEEEEVVFEDEEKNAEEEEKAEIKKDIQKQETKSKERISRLGSDEFFAKPEEVSIKEEIKSETGSDDNFEKITNKELVTGLGKTLGKKRMFKKKRNLSMDLSGVNIKNDKTYFGKNNEKGELVAPKKKGAAKVSEEKNAQKLADFFKSEPEAIQAKNKTTPRNDVITPPKKEISKPKADVHINGKFWKYFSGFSFLVVLVAIFFGLYLFLPKVTLTIHPKIKTQSEDFQISGQTEISEVSVASEKIPIKEVEVNLEKSQEFYSSGEEGISNQKAQGNVTIYNEYSSSSQPLVATTRFLSEDGKLFRLVEGVTIPGMSGSEPGKIEAKVVADEAGAEYNISPTKFTIPGFESSGEEKYSKFYAISETSMTGGGDGNEKVKTVTQSDINLAKEEIYSELKENVVNKVKEEVGDGWIVLDEALGDDETQFFSSNSAGEVAEKFSLTVKMNQKVLVFKEDDAKKIVAEKIAEENNGYDIEYDNIVLDFGKADADWENKGLVIRFRADVDMGASLDLDNIKQGILGKNEDELTSFLQTYSEIEKVDIDYWPFFITGKIPMYESRVDIVLDKE